MIVFKTYFKILNKYKFTVLMYTIILILFAGLNLETAETSMNFTASKPNIMIVNKDENVGITKNLIAYMKKNTELAENLTTDSQISDALFYREVSYIIYIPENYRQDFLAGDNPIIEVKSTGDYEAEMAEMLLARYLRIASIYQGVSEEKLIDLVNNTLNKEAETQITSKLDTSALTKATFYYNFTNYSILAGCVYVICLILSSFKKREIKKRTTISSLSENQINKQLLLSNALFAFTLWLIYIILSFVLLGSIMFSLNGLLYLINSFVFTFCALTIGLLIGNMITDKNAINGIMNVIALGSSFLCGAFVPTQWLPDVVLKIAHVIPTYWFIQNNEYIKELEVFNLDTLWPVIINLLVVGLFSIGFIMLTNIVTRSQRRTN